MRHPTSNIAIIGTGPVGLITAITLAKETTFQINLFGPKPDENILAKDTRTTAFMAPSIILLENCGVWSDCKKNASPLKHLRMIDDCGSLIRAPDCHFSCDELNMSAFAQNIPNSDLNKALISRIENTDQIKWIETKAVTKVENIDDNIEITTQENETYRAELCVGADGKNSICRTATEIKTTEWQYDQTAIACSFTHSSAHNATSTEIHRKTGPMTLIPLEEHRSSLVWSLTPEDAKKIVVLDDQQFSSLLFKNSHAILGTITSVEPRVAFPISGLKLEKFAENKIALVGEAAHVIPPIGAQGMNLGLRDAAHLAEILKDHTSLKGQIRTIEEKYNVSRKADILSRTFVVDILNKSLLLNNISLKSVRSAGLTAMRNFKSLRQLIMQQGLGDEQSLPSLMKANI
ncbi:UbiH/UbiF family hydroxylase [Hyphomicrobiales bacterium 4NK60-0047b]